MHNIELAAWRQEAIRLANARYITGQVIQVDGEPDVYRCISSSEPMDHVVRIEHPTDDPQAYLVVCDCTAAQYGKPCSHAGATLQLYLGCATPRTRNPSGYSPGGAEGATPQ